MHAAHSARHASWRTFVPPRALPYRSSDPAARAEDRELQDGRRDDKQDRDPDRPVGVVERALEVLAVEAYDQRRQQEHGRDDRELLDDLVLILGDQRLVVIAGA